MIPNLTGFEWTAAASGALTVLLLGGWGVLAARLEAWNAGRWAREPLPVNPADEKRWAEYRRTLLAHPGKPGVLPPAQAPVAGRRALAGVLAWPGEWFTRAAHWVAVKVLRLDRTEAKP